MSDDMFQLSIWFIKDVKRIRECTPEMIQHHVDAIRELMEQGKTLQAIRRAVERFEKEKKRAPISLAEAFGKHEEENLMKPGAFYYHRMLRNISEPVTMRWNEELRAFERKKVPFFLEIKRSFSMREMLDHFWRTNGIVPRENEKKEDEGRMRYLLQHYSVDEVLFAVDAAKTVREEEQKRPLRNIFELKDYMEEARFLIREKENIHQVERINRPIGRGENVE